MRAERRFGILPIPTLGWDSTEVQHRDFPVSSLNAPQEETFVHFIHWRLSSCLERLLQSYLHVPHDRLLQSAKLEPMTFHQWLHYAILAPIVGMAIWTPKAACPLSSDIVKSRGTSTAFAIVSVRRCRRIESLPKNGTPKTPATGKNQAAIIYKSC